MTTNPYSPDHPGIQLGPDGAPRDPELAEFLEVTRQLPFETGSLAEHLTLYAGLLTVRSLLSTDAIGLELRDHLKLVIDDVSGELHQFIDFNEDGVPAGPALGCELLTRLDHLRAALVP